MVKPMLPMSSIMLLRFGALATCSRNDEPSNALAWPYVLGGTPACLSECSRTQGGRDKEYPPPKRLVTSYVVSHVGRNLQRGPGLASLLISHADKDIYHLRDANVFLDRAVFFDTHPKTEIATARSMLGPMAEQNSKMPLIATILGLAALVVAASSPPEGQRGTGWPWNPTQPSVVLRPEINAPSNASKIVDTSFPSFAIQGSSFPAFTGMRLGLG